jgi:hypothetical protein
MKKYNVYLYSNASYIFSIATENEVHIGHQIDLDNELYEVTQVVHMLTRRSATAVPVNKLFVKKI